MVPTISTLPLELSLQTAQPELSQLTHLYSSPSRSPPNGNLDSFASTSAFCLFLEPPSPPNHTSSRSQQEWKALVAILLSQIPHLYHDSTLHPAWSLFFTSLKRITDHSASNKSIYQELLFLFFLSLFSFSQPIITRSRDSVCALSPAGGDDAFLGLLWIAASGSCRGGVFLLP